MDVYQYINNELNGLNNKTPTFAQQKIQKEKALTEIMAFYIAHAIKNKQKILQKLSVTYFSGVVTIFLWLSAMDSVEKTKSNELNPFEPELFKYGEATIDEQLKYYEDIDFHVMYHLDELIYFKYLYAYRNCFENADYGFTYHFINEYGINKLKSEFPEIWETLNSNVLF